MKITRKLFLPGILLVVVAFTAAAIQHFLYVYPTPETQSAFLRCRATSVVDRFKAKQGSTSQSSAESGARRKFALHHAEEEQYFVMASQLKPSLVAAMKDDICDKLLEDGARITGKSDSPGEFEVRYDLGNSRGVVALDPLQNIDPKRLMGSVPVPANNEALLLRMRIAETWSKAPPESRTYWPILQESANVVRVQ